MTSLGELVLGEELGKGFSRRVYVNNLNKDQVIKYEDEGKHLYQNVMEWVVWCEASDWHLDMKKWLAPCFHISPDGKYLVQARVTPVPKEKLPRLMPAWLNDFKVENFGRYKGRIVACDYGILIQTLIRQRKRGTKRAYWGTEITTEDDT